MKTAITTSALDIIGINKVFQITTQWDKDVCEASIHFNDVFGLLGGYGIGGYDLGIIFNDNGYLETMNFLLNTHKQIRFNQRQDRMILMLIGELREGEFLIIDCFKQWMVMIFESLE